ncbi:TMEM165/GDT1 family protein [Leptolyngbya sp. AN03gr2]|uniref:TMEM165/GDT1 family protein n=1 Tax=unclassified Leptolyngbya TaxID=2650499 RepID=UPI003D319F0B
MSSTNLPVTETQELLILEQTQPAKAKSNFLSVFGSTFITIFLAELGDKTQIATLLMSAQSHAPWIVFTGAASALVATSLVGVLVGRWLCQNVSPKTLEKATGAILLLVSALLVLDVVGM